VLGLKGDDMFTRIIVFYAIISVVLMPSTVSANFGGYIGPKLGGSGSFYNLDKNSKIELTRENLNIILGQRVNFQGVFHFKNTSNEEQKVILAFPQFSYWDAPWNGGNYVPVKYYPLNAVLRIDDAPTQFDSEKFSKRITTYNEIQLFDPNDFKSFVTEYANTHEAESPPSMPMLIWYLKEVSFPPGQTVKIDIAFTRPWFFRDEDWSYGITSDGNRYFDYITQTANTWAGGNIVEFTVTVTHPSDAWSNLEIHPEGWRRVNDQTITLSRSNWSPAQNEDLHFIWASKLHMISDDYHHCFQDMYYGDFHWRFLSDGSSSTAWSATENALKCRKFGLKAFNEKRERDEYGRIDEKEAPSRLVDTIYLINGFAKSKKLYEQNSRPRRIRFYISEDKNIDYRTMEFEEHVIWEQTFEIEDTDKLQILSLNRKIDISKILNFQILDIYEGSKYSDICISEVAFH
jgi:hypothetical protein